MLVKIIHISDLHIERNFNCDIVLKSMKEALKIKNNEVSNHIILLFTGDLTKCATKQQFSIFENFLLKIKETFESDRKIVHIAFVPGNHDISLNGKCEKFNMKDLILSSNIDNLVKDEIEKMRNFFEFSKKYELFLHNKFFDLKIIKIGEKNIKINLLNTAFFSTLDYTDKENHYFDPSSISNDENISYDCNIMIMHHSSEWFEDKSKEVIDNIVDQSDFYLYGHQHQDNEVKKKSSLGFLCGQFKTFFPDSSSNFYVHIIEITDDNLENKIYSYKAEYNFERKEYVCNLDNPITNNLFPKDITPNSNYNEIANINVNDKKFSLKEIFVMQNLSLKNDELIINSFDDLVDLINKRKYLIIEGSQQSGKTTLLKRIFLHFYSLKKDVYYINFENYKSFNVKNVFRGIVSANYKITYNEFLQKDINKKVLLIDDSSGMTLEFINEAKKHFATIILCKNYLYKSRRDLIITGDALEFEEIRIERFTYKQRLELIHKFCCLYNEQDHKNIISSCVESLISKSNFFDMSSPYYLSLIIDKIISEKLYESKDTADSFSIVFERNITDRLIKSFGESKVQDYFVLLRELSYIMYNSKTYKFTITDLSNTIKICKEKWNFKGNFDDIIPGLKKGNIIIACEDHYRFVDNNYYSFFVANYIRQKKEEEEDIIEDLKNLTSNVAFGNYSDILLFLAYFVGSKKFFENIMFEINKNNQNWDRLSFDKNNSYILKRILKEGVNINLIGESKESYENRIDNDEKVTIKNNETKNDDADYLKNENKNELDEAIKSLKLIEILAKGIASYKTKIDMQTREKMINSLNDAVFKLINKVFSFTDDEYEKLYAEFKAEVESRANVKRKNVTNKSIEKFVTNVLYDLLTTFTLNVLTGIATFSCSKNSIDIIDRLKDYDNEGRLIFDNVLFKTVYYERYGNEKKFVDYMDSIYNKIKSNDHKRLIKRIFLLFTITATISNENIDHCCSLMKINKSKVIEANSPLGKVIKIKDKVQK